MSRASEQGRSKTGCSSACISSQPCFSSRPRPTRVCCQRGDSSSVGIKPGQQQGPVKVLSTQLQGGGPGMRSPSQQAHTKHCGTQSDGTPPQFAPWRWLGVLAKEHAPQLLFLGWLASPPGCLLGVPPAAWAPACAAG